MVMWLYKQDKVSYHPPKFGGDRHSDSEDMAVFVCNVISQDHVNQGSCDFIDRIPLVTILLILVTIGTVGLEI